MRITYRDGFADFSELARERASNALAESTLLRSPIAASVHLEALRAWDPEAVVFDAWIQFVAMYAGIALVSTGRPATGDYAYYYDATAEGFRRALDNLDPRDVAEWAALFGETGLLPVADGHVGCVWLIGASGRFWYVFPWAEAVGLSRDFATEIARLEQHRVDLTPAG